MHRLVSPPVLAMVALLLAAASASCKDQPQPSRDAAPPANAVQAEMRLLHEAMRDSVTALANGAPDTIPALLEPVHHAREETEHALESGRYVLPKNAAARAEFVELDEAFHAELEKLVEAARTKDSAQTAAQLGVVLGKCQPCHGRFRP